VTNWEAKIAINGTMLTDAESRTVRIAMDTLAEVIAEQLAQKDDSSPLSDAYAQAIARVQSLIAGELSPGSAVN
jgi:hypothetical protein